MRYCNGSPISLSPATGVVRLTDREGDTWTVPLIGFAVVVDGYFRTEDDEDYEADTYIEPVVLEDGRTPVTLTAFLADRDDTDPRVIIGGSS